MCGTKKLPDKINTYYKKLISLFFPTKKLIVFCFSKVICPVMLAQVVHYSTSMWDYFVQIDLVWFNLSTIWFNLRCYGLFWWIHINEDLGKETSMRTLIDPPCGPNISHHWPLSLLIAVGHCSENWERQFMTMFFNL